MKRRRVGAVMTGDVVRAHGGTTAAELTRWMAEFAVNGVPVVDGDDKVIGVVSATDLERARRTGGSSPDRSARTLMSAPAHTVRADDSVVRAARLMSSYGVERLPVVDEEARLVGMLTRRDVLKLFARSDEEIREEVIDEVVLRTLWLNPAGVDVSVRDGVVTVAGFLESSGQAAALVRMTRRIDGVTAVVDRLTHRRAGPWRGPEWDATGDALPPRRPPDVM
ncbi:CBS domain-containing protein [Streptomyces yunnanensis]|uniref:CBS domain-containing protein n=1 Tax=Streptomyces yunnanensis TaxID=156453 RepID=A0ABY7ZZZ5_9ACTN|nr:CBS domain-containing protein [Streptomyces yunnanensis]WEB38086.1 CBS domain-containing protein [Streptomyces yunnanensis]